MPARPLHHSLLAILAAPLAHLHHGRYHKKTHHLAIDTFLNMLMYGALGVVLFFLLTRTGEPFGISTQLPIFRNGEAATVTWAVRNTTRQPVEDVRLALSLPEGWKLLADDSSLQVAHIEKSSTATLSATVLPASVPASLQSLHLNVTGESDGQLFVQHASIRVITQAAPVELTVSAPKTTAVGKNITTTILLVSTSDETVGESVVNVSASPGYTIVSSNPSLNRGRFVLSSLSPRERRTLTIVLKPTATGTVSLTVDLLFAQARDRQQKYTTTVTGSTSTNDFLTIPSSNTNLTAEALYTSSIGFQFGYGAFPPTVGEATTFRIFWYIRPSGDQAQSARVSATLPAGVGWIGNSSVTSGSEITYSSASRRVTWNVGSWERSDILTGSFDVRLTPTSSQIGTYPRLVNPATLSFLDQRGRAQSVMSGPATTRTADPRSASQGRVQK